MKRLRFLAASYLGWQSMPPAESGRSATPASPPQGFAAERAAVKAYSQRSRSVVAGDTRAGRLTRFGVEAVTTGHTLVTAVSRGSDGCRLDLRPTTGLPRRSGASNIRTTLASDGAESAASPHRQRQRLSPRPRDIKAWRAWHNLNHPVTCRGIADDVRLAVRNESRTAAEEHLRHPSSGCRPDCPSSRQTAVAASLPTCRQGIARAVLDSSEPN
ncbi:hypothetical protein CDD83_9543 [Cordyceps sp. RAO-2017]|nr:hypothetical protein CDD83_9543 [Cordyceps sp. RAO-2017]